MPAILETLKAKMAELTERMVDASNRGDHQAAELARDEREFLYRAWKRRVGLNWYEQTTP